MKSLSATSTAWAPWANSPDARISRLGIDVEGMRGSISAKLSLCVITIILSFGMALAIIDALDEPGGSVTPKPLTAVTINNGSRLIFPVSQKTNYAPDRAFDGSTEADRFWEAPGPFPIELTVALRQAVPLVGYALLAGEEPTRMPLEWLLEGSQDGRSWIRLDRQSSHDAWARDAVRRFLVRNGKPVNWLRFRFLHGANEHILRIYELQLYCAVGTCFSPG